MFAAVLLLPLLALFAATQGPSQCTRTYVVQQGDICDAISAAQNVSTYQLAAINDCINPQCTNLQPGSPLCLGTPGQDCTSVYVVQLDDTCDGIAGAYGISTSVFGQNNPQLDSLCDNLYVGEVVCTAQTVIVPPAPNGTIYGSDVPPTTVPANSNLPYCDEI